MKPVSALRGFYSEKQKKNKVIAKKRFDYSWLLFSSMGVLCCFGLLVPWQMNSHFVKDVYAAHNGGPTSANSTIRLRKPRGQNAIMDIVNPLTGKNISDEIYKDNETTQSGESSNRETPQPQVSCVKLSHINN